jgi:Ca-activated chloride channel family protein
MNAQPTRSHTARKTTMKRTPALIATILSAGLLLSGCASLTPAPAPADPNTLRILAGSEVKDMVPILETAAAEIGVKVELEYTGTLEGTQQVASGGASGYDATWFPNDRYLSLLPGSAAATSTSVKVMSSPVVLGLRAPVAARLGWDKVAPTWSEVAEAASAGDFTYGMTNPSASNSGFSALVSVATALSGTGSSLTAEDISAVTPALTSFFSAQKLTAGSSGWLAEQFIADPTSVDGIVNYESVLMGLDTGSTKLTIVTPTDGVVTSDYPLTLLKSAAPDKAAKLEQLTDWLLTPAVQKRIVDETHRRPGVPGTDTGSVFPAGVLFETPFPNTLDVANDIISTYLNTVRAPAQTIFVLDTSGSMAGERIDNLRAAVNNLAGADTSTTGGFAAFRERERVTLLPFNSAPEKAQTYDIPAQNKESVLRKLRAGADNLNANGGTAVYSSLEAAYKVAKKQQAERPDTFVSIVLMTDGENSEGKSAQEFEDFYGSGSIADLGIPTFVVLFGGGDVDELNHIAELTGGKAFDALEGDLNVAFREIRGYQ